jgi:MEMO1 family protein
VIRQPAVAGRFYPSDRGELSRRLQGFLDVPGAEPAAAVACMVPHAGYIYSGAVAGQVYARLALPRRMILVGPRHFTRGSALAVGSDGAWQTPLGAAAVDGELAAALLSAFPQLREDDLAHRDEHALEVQLPFLQHLAGDFRFVPVALGPVPFPALAELGRAVAEVVRQQSEPVLILASSDMNHYEDDATTRAKDARALAPLLRLDAAGLYDAVRRENISMCGYGAAVVMLVAATELGATRAVQVAYATSGDISGERDSVVGYAGVVVN